MKFEKNTHPKQELFPLLTTYSMFGLQIVNYEK